MRVILNHDFEAIQDFSTLELICLIDVSASQSDGMTSSQLDDCRSQTWLGLAELYSSRVQVRTVYRISRSHLDCLILTQPIKIIKASYHTSADLKINLYMYQMLITIGNRFLPSSESQGSRTH